MSSSSAHLSAFLTDIYKERLAEEARLGQVLAEESLGGLSGPYPSIDSSPSGQSGSPSQPKSLPSGSYSKASKSSKIVRAPAGGVAPAERPLPPSRPTVASRPALLPPDLLELEPEPLAPPVPDGSDLAAEDEHPTLVETTGGRKKRPPVTTTPPEATNSTVSSATGSVTQSAPPQRGLMIGLGALGALGAVALVGVGIKLGASTTPSPSSTGSSLVQPVQPPPPLVPATTGAAPAALGRVTIDTDPPGAHVKVDGAAKGDAPQTLEGRPGSKASLLVELPGYKPLSKLLIFPEGLMSQTLTLVPVAEPREEPHGTTGAPHVAAARASLALDGPDNVQVSLDGKAVKLPYKEAVSPGKHTLLVTRGDIDLHDTVELVVKAGEDASHTVRVATGKVQISAPTDSYAEVALHGHKLGVTPMPPVTLAVGEHTLELSNPDLGTKKSVQVKVSADQTATVRVSWQE
jgi:hypothetical protein